MSDAQLAVIGGGNMAQAILLGAFDSGAIEPAQVIVVEPDEANRAIFTGRDTPCLEAADQLMGSIGVSTPILLAVKPQVFPVVAQGLGSIGDRVVISIMAGVTSGAIRSQLGGAARVVRTMPNTPAQIGQGVTAVTLGAGASAGDDALANRLLGAVGAVISIDESMLDAFTAVVGSGPAYVFALSEAMASGARTVGFDAQVADRIVRGTIEGAAMLLAQRSDQSPEALRKMVTSKGGTTAAAIAKLDSGEFIGVVEQAIVAARDRGVELGKG
jgi:pyrroline-5-carboxylate reductase